MYSRLFALFAVLVLLAGCAMPGGAAKTGTGVTGQPGAVPNQSQGGGAQPNQPSPVPVQPQNPTPATTALPSEEITFSSSSWNIHGTYYDSVDKEPTKAIILLPMLNSSRSAYPASLISRLHDEMSDTVVLAVDLRGNGDSTNLGTWQTFQLEDFRGMQADVITAMGYLKQRHLTMKQYSVVGASMGSSAALMAGARDSTIAKVALLSPGMNYQGVDIKDASGAYMHSLFIATSREDRVSADAANTIYSLSPTTDKTLKIYEGSAHGTDMFDATKTDAEPLEGLLVAFLKK